MFLIIFTNLERTRLVFMLDWGNEPSGLLPHAYWNVLLVAYCGCLNFNSKSFMMNIKGIFWVLTPYWELTFDVVCVCFNRAPNQMIQSPQIQPKTVTIISEPVSFLIFMHLLPKKSVTTCEQNQIVPLTHSACQFQYCCCLNIIDFAYQ